MASLTDHASDNWIDYTTTVHYLREPALETAYQAATRELAAQPTATARIRLAVVLSAPYSNRLDLRRAMELLDTARSDSLATAEDSAFAEFLLQMVSRLDDLRAALSEESAMRLALQQQLDALKELETRLNAEQSVR